MMSKYIDNYYFFTDKNYQHTQVSETDVFKYRATTLLNLISMLFPEFGGKPMFESELRALKDQLLKLMNNVETEGNLNAGGKFEWLDSILVKVSNKSQLFFVIYEPNHI